MAAPKKEQTSIRLEPAYHQRLERAAKEAGTNRTALATRIIMEALDGAGEADNSESLGSELGAEILDRVDALEGHMRRLEHVVHLSLRTILGTFLDEHEAESARRMMDQTLGPLPTRPPQ